MLPLKSVEECVAMNRKDPASVLDGQVIRSATPSWPLAALMTLKPSSELILLLLDRLDVGEDACGI